MSGMAAYFARRLLLVPITFLAITFLVYSVLRIVPGGPIEQAQNRRRLAMKGEAGGASGGLLGQETSLQIDEEAMKELERFYALDRSIPVGYLQWLGLWPRERLRLVPGVPDAAHPEVFRALTERQEAVESARAAAANGLEAMGLALAADAPARPLEEAEVPEDVRALAARLSARTFGDRPELRERLAERGFLFVEDAWYAVPDATPPDAVPLLAAIGAAKAALAAEEERTGYVLSDDGHLLQRPFAALVELKRAETTAGEALGALLDEKGLIDWAGEIYRPLTDEERAARADLLGRMEKLAAAGFRKRADLFEALGAEGLTWRGGDFYVRVPPAGDAADPEWFATVRAVLAARGAAAARLARVRAEEGFEITDDLRIKRVESRVSGILELDFGRSYTWSEPVLSVIGSKMEVSIQFGLIGYFLSWLVCVPLGVVKAIRHRSVFDNLSSVLVFLGYAIPGFIVCLVLLSTVAPSLGLPLGGYKPPNIDELGWLDSVLGRMRYMLIPVIGYMIGGFATMTILMKNSLMENLGQDYVRTAFAKGLTERRVIFVHALRNSLIPITAGVGHALALLFAGSFLIEKTCNIDGMGLMGFQAIVERDYPILLGLMVFLVLIQLAGNIISDLVWALIDPRIRFEA